MSKQLIKIFFQMVKIGSESGHEQQFTQFCNKFLKKQGFSVSIDSSGNLYAENNVPGEPFLLCGHLDTVSPGNKIKPSVTEKTIQSDHTTILGADNKLALAIYFQAIKSLKKKKLIRNLEIVLTTKEELGLIGGKNLDFSKIKSTKGISIDAQGPVGAYITQSPHAELFTLNIFGEAAHAGYPEKGIDALKIFSKAYAKLKTGRLDPETTLNFGLISGGTAGNTVIDLVKCQGNLRSFNRISLEKLKKEIIKTFSKEAKLAKGKFTIEFEKVMDGYKINHESTFLKNLQEKALINLKPAISNFGSDANTLRAKGINIIELCHGIENVHTTQEKIDITKMLRLYQIVKNIIKFR